MIPKTNPYQKFLAISTLLISCSLFAKAPVQFKLQNKSASIQELRSGGSADIFVDVHLPQDNHIYLDHINTMSFNILTSFTTSATSGFQVVVSKLPTGNKYKEDIILKGKGLGTNAGSWKLTVYETKGENPSSRIHPVKIKINTQICNSKTNRCFRPQSHNLIVKVKINQPKKMVKSRAFSKIKWITKLSQAKSRAKNGKKNIYVIITAPTWCGYCKYMEKNTFTNDNLAAMLNKKFIPLRVLDTNPDKRSFRFSGYPTQILLGNSAKEITRSLPRNAPGLISSLGKYAKTDDKQNDNTTDNTQDENTNDSNETWNYKIQITGKFFHKGNGKWIEKRGDKITSYKENKRGNKFIVLQNIKTKEFIALPKDGGNLYIRKDNKWVESYKVYK